MVLMALSELLIAAYSAHELLTALIVHNAADKRYNRYSGYIVQYYCAYNWYCVLWCLIGADILLLVDNNLL